MLMLAWADQTGGQTDGWTPTISVSAEGALVQTKFEDRMNHLLLYFPQLYFLYSGWSEPKQAYHRAVSLI